MGNEASSAPAGDGAAKPPKLRLDKAAGGGDAAPPAVDDDCDWLQAVLEGLWPSFRPWVEKGLDAALAPEGKAPSWAPDLRGRCRAERMRLGDEFPRIRPRRVCPVANR